MSENAARGEMQYRILGRTGERVSAIGLGGWHLGFKQLDEQLVTRIVRSAIDRGITFLDNSWDYNEGASEIRMGKALGDGYRKKAFLMTKIDGRSKVEAVRQLDESLRRLRTDHIDLVQHHEIIRYEDPHRIFGQDGANAALVEAQLRFLALKGDHVGLLTFADDVRTYLAPRRGKGQFYRMLEALYNVQFEPVEADYAQALAYLGVKHKRRSLVIMFTDLVTLDAAKPLIAHLARLAQRHLPLCVVISDPNITRLAAQPPRNSETVYQRAVAEMLLDERRVVLDTLNRSGVLTLDVPADKLTVSVINKYLELKGRGAI